MEYNNLEIDRELAAFDEKIALAKLEATKAAERVDELEYQKARFKLDIKTATLRAIQEQQKAAAQQKPAG